MFNPPLYPIPYIQNNLNNGRHSGCVAANGREIPEDMIERWCAASKQGGFPVGEHTIGNVISGRPPLSTSKTVTLTVKIPVGMKATLVKKAKETGKTASGYTREIIAENLMATR